MNTHKSDLIHCESVEAVLLALLMARPEWTEPLTAVGVALGINPPAQQRQPLVIEMNGRPPKILT